MLSQTRKRPEDIAKSYVAAILLRKIVRPYGIRNFACKVTNWALTQYAVTVAKYAISVSLR